MPNTEAEKKKIAELEFGINDAINNLDKIDEKLKSIAQKSEVYSKTISSNLNKNNTVNIVDVKAVEKDLDKVAGMSKSKRDSLNAQLIKGEFNHQNKMTEIAEKAEKAKELAAYKSTLKQEEYNNRVAKSTETMYDKIMSMGQTYLLYQGFNALKQGIRETIDEMVDLEERMIQIDRVLNESSLDINLYRDRLMGLAYNYANSMDNVTDIALRLAQAGFDSNEVIALTEKTLLALNTAELNATQATDDMVAVMAQWNLMTGTAAEQADSYGDIIDKVNKVADNFPTTSADIMDALKKVSSAFNLAGASIDETIATIVAAEKASQRGGKAIGTALSNITQQLKEAKKLEIAESLGLNFFTDETKTQFKDIMVIFQEMSEKMQQLKNAGKENSVEMQNLLSIFTVFRRNIGASLLGEMNGQDSTYFEVLTKSAESAGYSLQENEKYLKSAKAAQQQFNIELLKLKTEVWDKGIEDVFRAMMTVGKDVISWIQIIIDKIGLLPTAIGAATLAFTAFNKQLKIQVGYKPGEGFGFINSDFFDKIKKAKEDVKALNQIMNGVNITGHEFSEGFKQYVNSVGYADVTTKGYISTLIAQKAATLAAEVATIALNAALTLGLSAAITGAIGLINNLIHAQEKYIEKQTEMAQKNKQAAEQYKQLADSLDLYIDKLNEMDLTSDNNSSINPENLTEVINLQTKINVALKETGEQVKLVETYTDSENNIHYKLVDNYKEELRLIKEKAQEERKNEAEKRKEELKNLNQANKFSYKNLPETNYKAALQINTKFKDVGMSGLFEADTLNKQLNILREWEEELNKTGKTATDAYEWITKSIEILEEKQNNVNESLEEYLELQSDIAYNELFGDKTIENTEDLQKALNEINGLDLDKLKEMGIDTDQIDDLEEFKNRIVSLAREDYPELIQQNEEVGNSIRSLEETMKNVSEGLSDLQSKYSVLETAEKELSDTNEITASTFKNIIDNNLLQYLDIVNGKLVVNKSSMEALAEQTKIEAIENLQAAAAEDIHKLSLGDVNSMSQIAKSAIANFGDNAANAGDKAQTAAGKILQMAQALREATAAAKDEAAANGVEDFAGKSQAIINSYTNAAKKISSISIKGGTTSKSSGGKSSGGKSSGSSGSSGSTQAAQAAAERAAKQAEEEARKAEEERYKNSLATFTNYVKEKERIENRWVKNQKDLGLLSNKDYLYITQQRIERYKEYLDQVNKMTWLSEEDRTKLIKEYTEEIEDLQVDYLKYLEDILDDEIKAIKDANKEKIKLIEDEAKARIDALKKMKESTSKERDESDYQKERKEILDEISYWEQRTGREAQESLKKAKEKLVELDEEWRRQLEDWSIEDQIQAIEDERDAEIKAIEDSQEAQIKALQEAYDARVKLYAESGQLIYEQSQIESANLYNSYKQNFVNPIMSDLDEIQKKIAGTTAPSSNTDTSASSQQYETYTIKSGDTLSGIAKRYSTTVAKLMEANPYITNANKIYAGKTLQIPKFHEGGIVGGNQEAFALLKPDEVILKPEWAEGINKLAQMAKKSDNPINNNNTNINVKGDLVRIDANIKDKSDAEYLTRKVEKMLKDKFNINK